MQSLLEQVRRELKLASGLPDNGSARREEQAIKITRDLAQIRQRCWAAAAGRGVTWPLHSRSDTSQILMVSPLLREASMRLSGESAIEVTAAVWPVSVRGGRFSRQRKFLGQIIARHICATGELSNPRPSLGWRK